MRSLWLHRVDPRSPLCPYIHPSAVREAIAVGAFDLRECRWCGAWLAPDLWDQECPGSPLRLLLFWRRR